MRNSWGNAKKKLLPHSKRGLFARSRQARARMLVKALATVLLVLLVLVLLWLTVFSPGAATHKKNLKKIELWEEALSGKSMDFSRDEAAHDQSSNEEYGGDGGKNGLRDEVQEEISAEDRCDRSKYPATEELASDRITILVNGYSESRLSLLQTNVQVYSTLPFVDSIYILWGNTSTPPELLQQWNFDSLGAPIFIVMQDSTSLNDRFLPRKYILTRSVMICDDDITVDVSSLKFALEVWNEDRSRIVGFFSRAHVEVYGSKSWIYAKQEHKYSIMLTKLMILATEYLYLYTCEMPQGVKEYVDDGMNCEDIAMNFLVSNRSGRGPFLVDGQARDWGDPRNSDLAEKSRSSALSSRKDHRQHRGDCIAAFEALWKGMQLRYSYSKASLAVDNPVHCEKFGYLIDCDISVGSQRDVRRMLGQNIVSSTNRYAYVTFLSSDHFINACLVLAQSLRTSGTIHDFVLLLGPSCTRLSDEHPLNRHYDKVVMVNASTSQYGKLSSWLLVEYSKVVYIELNSLVLANLDHLFDLPEITAAPRLFVPDKFSTGLLVLRPSNDTYVRLVRCLEDSRAVASSKVRRQDVLNSYFSGWFQWPAENRLPARYNVPVSLSKQLEIPSWFDVSRPNESFGPPIVVRFGDAKLKSEHCQSDAVQRNGWCDARARLFESLLDNDLRPLKRDNFSNWAPATMNSVDVVWPTYPQASLTDLGATTTETSQSREAFATVLYGAPIPEYAVAGWAESFHHHHNFHSRRRTMLLVLSTLDPDYYREYITYFDEIKVVEPIFVDERVAQKSFALLHLWNQVDFDKLVYVDANSLFVDNCNALLDYVPFAAVPSVFPPDTFSTHVMTIEPNQQTFDSFMEELLSFEFENQSVDRFLNAFYVDWYQKPIMHRISPSYKVNVAFKAHLRCAPPCKVLSFDLDWLPDESANLTRLWREIVCELKPAKVPGIMTSMCSEATGI